MRKITVMSMISLDGVLQAPGGPGEDTSGGFAYGGWVAPFSDAQYNEAVAEELQPADYLLGRKTFEIWENYWPQHADYWPGINEGTKYVYSGTRTHSDWAHSEFIDSLEGIEKMKASEGRDIQVWGSSELIHLLLRNGLVDELRLKIHPLLLGRGKRLFADDAMASAFEVVSSSVTDKGVILAHYRRAGDVRTGSMEV